VVVTLSLNHDTVDRVFPLIRKNLGLGTIAETMYDVFRFDGSPIWSRELWQWDRTLMAYRMRIPNPDQDIQFLLCWDSEAGWLFRPDDPGTPIWAPIYEPDDSRNRPDQAHLAMVRLRSDLVDTTEKRSKVYRVFRAETANLARGG
jgi:hypothetical protein